MNAAAPRSIVDDDKARNRDLAAIHIGKAALGWSDDDYRHILFTVCSVKSAAELDFAGRKRFLDHLRACGWSGKTSQRRGFTGRQGKIWSLWQQLRAAGRVTDGRLPALDQWVNNQLGVRKMTWLNMTQQDLAIERMKMWLKRPDGAQDAA